MAEIMPKTTKDIGKSGEQICAQYLVRAGFSIEELNHWQKWGEIDIIAKKGNKIHFIEVKTVSHETKFDLIRSVTHGTWRPEENVHAFKLRKLSQVVATWLEDQKWTGEWQIDVAAIHIVPRETFATVNFIPNVIIH